MSCLVALDFIAIDNYARQIWMFQHEVDYCIYALVFTKQSAGYGYFAHDIRSRYFSSKSILERVCISLELSSAKVVFMLYRQ
jgi:hypothetical protein